MRHALAALALVGCTSHREPPPRVPASSPDARCTLDITDKRILVDGERGTREQAIAYCKRMPGGAVVTVDDTSSPAWTEMRTALWEHDVRFHVRGRLCWASKPDGCLGIRHVPFEPRVQRITATPPVTSE